MKVALLKMKSIVKELRKSKQVHHPTKQCALKFDCSFDHFN